MKDWRQIDQLDEMEEQEAMEYIQSKFGEYKMKIKRESDSDYVYFKCPKNNCKFQIRWETSGGALHCRHCANCEHNHSMEEISSAGDQPFQTNMEIWRKVDQMDDVEQPDSLAYIRKKYGTYKLRDGNGTHKNFVYFHCTKKSSGCKFNMRWDKRSGTLEALYEHNHSLPLEPLPDKLLTNENKDATQKEENKKINQPSTVPPIAKNSVPKKKNIQKPANGGKKPKKGEMPKKVPFLSHEEARRIMMGLKPTKVSKEDKRGRE